VEKRNQDGVWLGVGLGKLGVIDGQEGKDEARRRGRSRVHVTTTTHEMSTTFGAMGNHLFSGLLFATAAAEAIVADTRMAREERSFMVATGLSVVTTDLCECWVSALGGWSVVQRSRSWSTGVVGVEGRWNRRGQRICIFIPVRDWL
jgi:hypothetical protein